MSLGNTEVMDTQPNPKVDARRRRALLVAILAFPVAAGLATWGAAGLGVFPGWVHLDEGPAPAVVLPALPGSNESDALIVQPSVEPGPLPTTMSAVEEPPPPAVVPPSGPSGSAGDAGSAASGSPDTSGGTGSGAPVPPPASQGPPNPGGSVPEPLPAAGSDDGDDRDDDRDDRDEDRGDDDSEVRRAGDDRGDDDSGDRRGDD